MKAGAFDYVRPQSLAEAISILAGTDRDAQVMAGGQSLVAMMNLRVASPDLIVDIERLDELRVASDDAGTVWLGACVTHAAIEDGRVPDPSRGVMPHVASNLAYRAVRTRGTIGGSLALSDPAADWLTVLAALDAQVVLRGPGGQRGVSVLGFTTGVYETVRARDEIIEGVRIPKLSADATWGFSKFCRKSGEFAHSIATVVRDPARNYARAVLGAVAGAPIVLPQTSQLALAGETGPSAWQRAIADDLAAQDEAFDDFKSSLHTAMTMRALAQGLS
jgi:carbon-monoxide dehydrogenase medium subunit